MIFKNKCRLNFLQNWTPPLFVTAASPNQLKDEPLYKMETQRLAWARGPQVATAIANGG
jgi:hypothetical protein